MTSLWTGVALRSVRDCRARFSCYASRVKDIARSTFVLGLACIVAAQAFCGFWELGMPFYDGRYHFNWGPPFWLLKAQETNDIGLAASYFGVAGYHSHPQLIGPVVALWTRLAGYDEASIRGLALLLALASTVLLALWVRRYLGAIAGLCSGALFSALPIIFIYGKKLDQENLLLVFLLLQLFAYSIVRTRRRAGLALIAVSSFLMMSSDWSGGVFAVALSAAAALAWGRAQRPLLVQTALSSAAGVVLALAAFLLQTALQQSASSLGTLAADYYQVWQYRAGHGGDPISAPWWLYRQWGFLQTNFSVPLFVLGIAGLGYELFRRFRDERRRELALFATAALLGSLCYQLAVAQASGIHIYYQFYYAVPVAVGLFLLASAFATRFIRNRRGTIVVCGILVLASAAWSFDQYRIFVHEGSWGDESDINLLKNVRAIPADQQVVAGEADELMRSWFDNPNIRYYAGRAIPAYVLETGVPEAPYQIVPIYVEEDYLRQINAAHGYGRSVRAESLYCSTHYCLLHLTDTGRLRR